MNHTRCKRRTLLVRTATLVGSLTPVATSLAAMARAVTPAQSRGPFYPVDLPLDSDNDLVTVQGEGGTARGEIAQVMGQVVDTSGQPVGGARVEIWQCDANGRYRHPGDRGGREPDPGFQGYGSFQTREDGWYRFRTIKPVPYPGRAPHIHFAVRGPGVRPLVTQLYVAGAPENQHDFLLNHVRPAAARERLLADFQPNPDVTGELLARFDIVMRASG